MAYQRSPTRAPNDRRTEYAVADDARAEIRKQLDALLDNNAGKWRYKAAPVQLRPRSTMWTARWPRFIPRGVSPPYTAALPSAAPSTLGRDKRRSTVTIA
jgi:hypothetical protein